MDLSRTSAGSKARRSYPFRQIQWSRAVLYVPPECRLLLTITGRTELAALGASAAALNLGPDTAESL